MNEQEFIWYCPRTCNGILMKTATPFLYEGKFQCKRCLTVFTTIEIMVRNKKNVLRYYRFLAETRTKWVAAKNEPELASVEELTPET